MFLTAEARKQRLAKSRLDQWLRSSDLAGACVRNFTVLSYEWLFDPGSSFFISIKSNRNSGSNNPNSTPFPRKQFKLELV